MSDVTPFDFSALTQISREEARLLNGLQSYLPRIGFTEGLSAHIRSMLRQQLGPTFSFDLESMKTVKVASYLEELPTPGIYLPLGMVPLEQKALCEVDLFMAHVMIDHLLGGPGEPMTMIRPLSEIEQGIFSYLVLKVLSKIFERCGGEARVHFRLEGVKGSVDEVRSIVRPTDIAIAMTFRLLLEERSGYFRLLLPSPFVQKGFLEPFAGGKMSEAEATELLGRLTHLGFVGTTLWADAGHATLKPKQLKNLEPGDVLLLDEASVAVKESQITGRAALRIGRGAHGSYQGRIVSASPLKVEIEGMGKR